MGGAIQVTAATPIQFGRIPFWVVDSGLVAAMRPAETAAYLVLTAHANGRTGQARPSIERIARRAGLTDRSTRRGIGGLERLGVVRVVRGGGRNLTNTYELILETLTPMSGFSPANPDTGVPKPGHRRAQTLTRVSLQQKEQKKNSAGSPRRSLASGGSRLRPAGAAADKTTAMLDARREEDRQILAAGPVPAAELAKMAAAAGFKWQPPETQQTIP